MAQPNRSIWRVPAMVAPATVCMWRIGVNIRVVQEFVVAIPLDDAIARFLAFRKLRHLSDGTLDRYAQDFRLWTSWRTRMGHSPILTDITLAELRAFLAYLSDEHVPHSTNPRRAPLDRVGLKPHTIAGHWKLLHAAWAFWIDEDLLTDRQQAFFMRGRVPSPKIPHEIRPTYEVAQIEALIAADGPKSRPESAARDKAILLLLYDTGMRVSELCGLCDKDMHAAERQAVVHGKGKKQRYVFWTERAQAALDAYLAVRCGVAGGPLLRALGTGGRARTTAGQGIGPGVVRDMIERRAARAAQTLPPAVVHALRHTFAHRFLDHGGDGLHLQQILGHESIVTTMRYVRENPMGLRKTYRRILGD
jgi:site-specific recombinase XerD